MHPKCRHIRTNGLVCESNALRGKSWCFYHDNHYRQNRAFRQTGAAVTDAPTRDYGAIPVAQPVVLELPFIEDLSSIQLAIARVVQALAANQIDNKRAGLLLYGLQIAAQNLPKREPFSTVVELAHTAEGIPYDAAAPPPPVVFACQDDDDEGDDEDYEEEDGEEEDEEEDDSGQTLHELQLLMTKLRLAALNSGIHPDIVFDPSNEQLNPAPFPCAPPVPD